MSASVLYDAPGPKAVVRNRIYAVVGTLAIAALIGASIVRLADKGHLAPEMWDIFNYAGIRQNIADALIATLKAFGLAAIGSLVLGVLLVVGGSPTTSRSAGRRPPSSSCSARCRC